MLIDVVTVLKGLLLETAGPVDGKSFSAAAADSRRVVPGALFVAIRGIGCDGHKFIADALRRGAAGVVGEECPAGLQLPASLPFFRVSNSAAAAARLFQAQYGYPDRRLKLVGVTGTNGKTTSAYLVQNLLNYGHIPCGRLTTVSNDTGAKRTSSSCTTPDSETFYASLREMADADLRAAAFELSSHGLDQHRAFGIGLKAAILTNITRDHLDYHRTVEAYYQAKKRCFTDLLDFENGMAICNYDDRLSRKMALELSGVCRCWTFGRSKSANWQISEERLGLDGIAFRLTGPDGTFDIASPLVGAHNVENLTGALLAARVCGLDWDILCRGAAQPVKVPGRLELLRDDLGTAYFIDYAHTDDALERVLSFLRPLTSGRLIAVFGAGGNRDRGKRFEMGDIATRLADIAVITSDNPRNEEPEDIISDVVSGVTEGRRNFVTIVSRKEAIEYALGEAREGDVLLLAGKGHENYIIDKNGTHYFSEKDVIMNFIERKE